MDSYRKKQWVEFREAVIELDDYACCRCGRSRSDGAILQVHHKRYIKEKAPWEYPLSLCETLCKACHASEHGIIRPDHGWTLVGEDDLGGLYGACERCGTEIRYAFLVQHPLWEPITVGTVCCDDITGTQMASDLVSELRKYADRRKNFCISKRWQVEDGVFMIRQKGFDIQIHAIGEKYQLQMNGTKGKALYELLVEAKKRVFDVIESGKADEYFSRKAKPQ